MVDYEPQHRAGRDARYRVPIRRIADALPERHQGPGLGHHRGLNQGRQQPVPHALTEDPESDHRPIAFTARWAVATPLSIGTSPARRRARPRPERDASIYRDEPPQRSALG